jgi:hypothetical protein
MFVTKNDQNYETFLLDLLVPKVKEFRGLSFRHQQGYSVFDFHGYKKDELVAEVDVKVREAASADYKDYFVSQTKVGRMRKNQRYSFYMIYYFKKDHRVKVYDLRECQRRGCLKEKKIQFKHKRSGEQIEKAVFSLPRGQWIFDAFIL